MRFPLSRELKVKLIGDPGQELDALDLEILPALIILVGNIMGFDIGRPFVIDTVS